MSDPRLEAWEAYLLGFRRERPPPIGRSHIWPPAQNAQITCVGCGLTVHATGEGIVDLPPEIDEPCPGDPEGTS
jgi:hypothetical protein